MYTAFPRKYNVFSYYRTCSLTIESVLLLIECVLLQRKVMYTAFRRKYKDTVKVVQFAGAVLETAAYHHGDAALQARIPKSTRYSAFRFSTVRAIVRLHSSKAKFSGQSDAALQAQILKSLPSLFSPLPLVRPPMRAVVRL
jgi:hypothetical protein